MPGADRDGLTAGPADRLQAVGGAIVALDSGLGHMSEASSRFWALEESLNRDELSSGVIANDIRRSTMHREIANLLIDSVITLDDLDGFTEDIKSYAQHWIGQ